MRSPNDNRTTITLECDCGARVEGRDVFDGRLIHFIRAFQATHASNCTYADAHVPDAHVPDEQAAQ